MALASLAEFYLYQARYLAARYNLDFAVVWNNDRKLAIGCSAPHGPGTYQTAAVNAMMNLGFAPGAVSVCTSYVPTERCLGMAKMRQFRKVFYAAGGQVVSCDVTQNPPWLPGTALGGGQLDALKKSTCGRMPAMLGQASMQERFNARIAMASADLPNDPAVLGSAKRRKDFVTNWERSLRFLYARPAQRFVAPPDARRFPAPRGVDTGEQRNAMFNYLAFAVVQAAITAQVGGAGAGRRIGCVLVSPQDTILAWGVNLVNLHVTLHGEVNLVTSYVSQNGALPAGCRVYTTLEPCHMCAGMLYESTAANNIRVYYGQADPLIVNNTLSRATRQFSLITDGGFGGDLINVGIDHRIPRLTDVLGSAAADPVFASAIPKYRAYLDLLRAGDERAIWWQGWGLLQRIQPNLAFDPRPRL